MTIEYHVRPEPDLTIKDVYTALRKNSEKVLVETADFSIGSDSDGRVVAFSNKAGDENYKVVCDTATLVHLAQWVGIPAPFIKRVDEDIQEWLLHTMLDRPSRDVLVTFSENGITDIESPHSDRIDPIKMVEIAERVLGDDARVLDVWMSTKEYRFEVVKNWSDPSRVTCGLRIGQDTQHNLSPWISLILYCPWNSNVFEIATEAHPADGRKETNAEILTFLENDAQRCMDRVEVHEHALKDLKDQKVKDPIQFMMRVGREAGLTTKLLSVAADELPRLIADVDDASVWDVIQGLANQATHSDVWGRANIRRKIESGCGAVISSHSHRCPVCMNMVGKPIHPDDLVPEEIHD